MVVSIESINRFVYCLYTAASDSEAQSENAERGVAGNGGMEDIWAATTGGTHQQTCILPHVYVHAHVY